MDVAEVFVVECDVDAHLLGDADGLRNARIIDVEADCAAGEREIRAMAAIGRCERRVQKESYRDRFLVEDLTRDASQPRGPGRVGAGGTDHHRSHDVEDGYFTVVTDGHRDFNG